MTTENHNDIINDITDDDHAKLVLTFKTLFGPDAFGNPITSMNTRTIYGQIDQIKSDFVSLKENPKKFIQDRYIFDEKNIHSLVKAVLYTYEGIETI